METNENSNNPFFPSLSIARTPNIVPKNLINIKTSENTLSAPKLKNSIVVVINELDSGLEFYSFE